MAVLTIGLTTITPGTPVVVEGALASGLTQANLSIDRTVGASSLNSLTSASKLSFKVQISQDGGVTWDDLMSATTNGGIYKDRQNVTITHSFIATDIPNPANSNRHARATLSATGTSISVSGTLTLT